MSTTLVAHCLASSFPTRRSPDLCVAPRDARVHRGGISWGVGNLHAFLWAVMWRGKPTQQRRTEAIGGFIATLPLRHVQAERREGQRKSYSLEAGREGNELRLCGG